VDIKRFYARIIAAATGLAAVHAAYSTDAAAQAEWKPQRPLEIVAPVTAGGGLDRPVRVLQQIWTEGRMVPVPVNVNNKPGGGQSVGLNYIHQSPGDAHRLALMSSPLLSNYITGSSKLQYTDFTMLGFLFTEYMVVSVKPDSALRNAGDLVARVKAAPDALSVAIGTALGNTTHTSIALPFKRAGVDIRRMKNVVFPSAGQSMTAVLGGHVDVVASTLSMAVPHKRNGKLRMLAVTAPKRMAGELGDIPTWKEQGVDVVVSNWRFITAPAGLSAAQIAWWDALFARTVKSLEWKKVIEEYYWVDEYVPSRAARKILDQESVEMREVLTDLGLAK
jgi:putative tricarboxylic transport membrane protein